MLSVDSERTTGTRYSAAQFLLRAMAWPMPRLSARFFAAYANRAGRAAARPRGSKMDSTGCERKASWARLATTSSASCAKTARISARSAAERCAPPVQTAILRSRVARPWRSASTSSGLRVSTGCRPQVFLAKHYCTGGAWGTDGRDHLALHFQHHRAGERTEGEVSGDAPGGCRGATLRGKLRVGGLLTVRQVVLSKQVVFVKAQVLGDGAHEAAIENAARELVPVFISQGLQKS